MSNTIEGTTSKKYGFLKFVDYSESYGRHIIEHYSEIIKDRVAVVCDLGVGYGNDLEIFRRKYKDAKLIGIDFFTVNEKLLREKGIELKVHNIEVDDLDIPDNSVDIIIINQVLEHVKEIFWIHHQIAKKLKVGGHLIIGIPNLSSFLNRLTFLAGWQPSQLKTYSAHVRGYAFNEIPKFLQVCFPGGYKVVKKNGAQFYPFPKSISRFLCSLLPSFGHSAFYLLKKEKTYNEEFLEHPIKAQLETNFYLGR